MDSARTRNMGRPGGAPAAFTLIELLVVIAIIALLIGILLPALGGARSAAQAQKCAVNSRTVAMAVAQYVTSNRYFPPSYVYGADAHAGNWRLEDQQEKNPNPGNGYIHWSWALLDGTAESGGVSEEAFTCPSLYNKGAPATNPGANTNDWESWQRNDLGNPPGVRRPKDRQAKRMAYTGNAAIFPRNKFYQEGSLRKNRLANPAGVDGSMLGPAGTILATEFVQVREWRSIATNADVVKSHRPVTPFIGGSSGTDVYNEPDFGNQPRFFYPPESSILRRDQLGENMIENGLTTLNAVGRAHPGGDTTYGGTASFSFVDGHVEQMTVLDSIRKRKWGDRFHSLTGRNVAVDMTREE